MSRGLAAHYTWITPDGTELVIVPAALSDDELAELVRQAFTAAELTVLFGEPAHP